MDRYMLQSGEVINKYSRALVIHLKEDRKVLSTAHLNGGERETIAHVLNFDSTPENGSTYCQDSETYVEDLKIVAKKLQLDVERTVAVSTTVNMDNAAICEETYKDLTVTAVVTAGITGNAGRVGDPAWFHEEDGKPVVLVPGTINIILLVNKGLNPGTMSRCIVTATEAKTAALQELVAGSVYTQGLATGTGTDETIIVCNKYDDHPLMFAGKHSKLGELIGTVVKRAVKESLEKYSGLNPDQQRSVAKRLERFGVETFQVQRMDGEIVKNFSEKDLQETWDSIDLDPNLVARASMYVHLLDQLSWNLLSREVVVDQCKEILTILMSEPVAICLDESFQSENIQSQLARKFFDVLIKRFVKSLKESV